MHWNSTSGMSSCLKRFILIFRLGRSAYAINWMAFFHGNLAQAGQAAKPKGHMYEVQINADPEQFLDWDKPLSEQPESVRKAVDEAATAKGVQLRGKTADRQKDYELDTPIAIDRIGSAGLKSRGVPGVKYLDAGSRGKGDGSRNYVVFDDRLITILRKYGLLPPIAAGAAYGASQDQQQPAY